MSDEVWELIKTVYSYAVHGIWLLLLGMARWGFSMDRKYGDLQVRCQMQEREHEFLRERFDSETDRRDEQRGELVRAIRDTNDKVDEYHSKVDDKIDTYQTAVLGELRHIRENML